MKHLTSFITLEEQWIEECRSSRMVTEFGQE
jgi:hypothetical protein